ncbi:hypothetical protein DYI95_001575 [Thermaerobacter sp. PB12/4term]|uniref:YtrH family sporulation protein n=1 Tax=Thermaerobacter sp. PB12/4term TaxID=2293838 RepID=UPI000E328AEA|nr:YtrH family sporulation protein [Thermaerobacter sp. PB12/4term]QIA26395.1 hypothetical protein DYI95_001575 [Thermaerobacter sp. PB12/4term]
MARLSLGHLMYVACVAAGIVVGGSLAGGLARLLFVQVPLDAPSSLPVGSLPDLASRLKLWGTFAALGGTLTALQHLESGILGRSFGVAATQLLLILSAFTGAHLAYVALRYLAGSPPGS